MSILSQLKNLILDKQPSWGIVTHVGNTLSVATEKGVVICNSFEPTIRVGDTVIITDGRATRAITNLEQVYWVP